MGKPLPRNQAAERLIIEWLRQHGPQTTRELMGRARRSIEDQFGRWQYVPGDPRHLVATLAYQRLSRLHRAGVVARAKDPVDGSVLWWLDLTEDGLVRADVEAMEDTDG